MLIYFAIVVLFLCGIKSEDYYVIPSDGDRSSCPSGVKCNTLSHYATTIDQFSSISYVTFLFLDGDHELGDSHQLYIHDLSKVTMKRYSLQRYHQSSTIDWSVTINCQFNENPYDDGINIHFTNVTTIRIVGLTISGCSFSADGEIQSEVHIIQSSFVGGEVSIDNYTTVTIRASSFTFYNSSLMLSLCASTIVSSSQFVNSFLSFDHSSTVTIADSKFDGTPLFIILYELSHLSSYLEISNTNIHDIYVGSQAGLVVYCRQPHINVYLNNVTIANNSETGMLVDGSCSVIFRGQPSVFANNHSPANGGGMWINSISTIISDGDTIVLFFNNTSDGHGGAIFIANKINVIRYCSFKNFQPAFINNSALIGGDNVYGGMFFNCYGTTVRDSYDCDKSDILMYFPRPISSYVSTDPFLVCLCTENNTVDCSKRTLDKEIYPGQNITLSLVTVGRCEGTSPSGLEFFGSNGVEVVTFSNQWTEKVCQNFTYGIKEDSTNTTTSDNGQLTITLGISYFINRNYDTLYSSISPSLVINVQFLPCSFGLKLHHSKGICICNDVLNKLEGITCNMSNVSHPISRSGNNWLYYSHQDSCTVAYTNCPFDYCNTSTVHLNLNQSDLQCTHNRSGILCGQCQEGQSVMLGSNQCAQCNNYYLFMLPVFVVAGFCIVFVLLALNLTISVGTINGLLFYANIFKFNQPVIFPDGDIPVLTQFIAWLNLDFGFKVCLFDGLDGYWKTWLQFAFSLSLIAFIILCCKYSGRLSRLLGKNLVSVLSTLIFMAHSKILLTARNALMISPIKCDEKEWKNVWSVDGNIEYLTGRHIPLFLVSLIFLLIGLIYTVMIFSSQWLQRYGGRYCTSSLDPYVKLKPFIDAHTGPYKDKYRFWTGLLLIIRFILTGVFSYTTGTLPQVNYFITAFVSCCLLAFVRGKYNKNYNTILEMFYLSNLFITSFLNVLLNFFKLNFNQYINGISVGLSLAVFIGTLLVHVVQLIKIKFGDNKCNKVDGNQVEEGEGVPLENAVQDNGDNGYSPAVVINKRESLIFDFEPTH